VPARAKAKSRRASVHTQFFSPKPAHPPNAGRTNGSRIGLAPGFGPAGLHDSAPEAIRHRIRLPFVFTAFRLAILVPLRRQGDCAPYQLDLWD